MVSMGRRMVSTGRGRTELSVTSINSNDRDMVSLEDCISSVSWNNYPGATEFFPSSPQPKAVAELKRNLAQQ